MTNEEAARERERARQEASEQAEKERNQSGKDREQEVAARNAEVRQQKEAATNALISGSANIKLSEIAKQGGPIGRKLERELRQFQQTGRVSSWLAGETLKAEAAQSASQQAAFRQAVTDVISIPQGTIQIGPTEPYKPLTKKPEINDETPTAQQETCVGLALYIKEGDVWISSGTVGTLVPVGFDPLKGKRIATSGSGNVWAEVNINQDTGEIVSVEVNRGSSTPTNTNTSFYYTIGHYEYSGNPPSANITNYGCGSVNANVCRLWYRSTAPYYGVTMSR